MRVPPAPEKSNETDKSRQDAVDLGERILLHAQVHSFAIEYLVSDLEQYSMDCMESCLMEEEKVSPQLLPNLLKTINHIYENTPSSNLSQTIQNRAREAICAFVAYNHFILVPESPINPLGDANHEFLADLSHQLARIALEKTSNTGSPEEKSQAQMKEQAKSIKWQSYEIATLKDALAASQKETNALRRNARS